MKQMIAGLGSLLLGATLGSTAYAQEQTAPPPDTQQAPPLAEPAPAPAPAAQTVYTYATGSWVYAADRGWVWIPNGATPSVIDGVPYTYLYTPAYGWTWYVSPWGWGPYHYGAWVSHPWRPYGWRGGWVAHPHVAVRLGVGYHGGYYHGGFHRR